MIGEGREQIISGRALWVMIQHRDFHHWLTLCSSLSLTSESSHRRTCAVAIWNRASERSQNLAAHILATITHPDGWRGLPRCAGTGRDVYRVGQCGRPLGGLGFVALPAVRKRH